MLVDFKSDELFNIADSIVIFSYQADNIYSTDVIEDIQEIHHELEALEFVDEVTSVLNVEDVKGENNTITQVIE